MIFYLVFLYPILEIAAFILVAKAIGWTSTLALALATSFIGATLLRIHSARGGAAQNWFSTRSVENYLFVNLGCFLLILPGFITDVLGLTLTIPVARNALIGLTRFFGLKLRTKATGPFAFFRAYQGGADFGRFADDEPIDVASDFSPNRSKNDESIGANANRSDDGDEPIDVEYTVR